MGRLGGGWGEQLDCSASECLWHLPRAQRSSPAAAVISVAPALLVAIAALRPSTVTALAWRRVAAVARPLSSARRAERKREAIERQSQTRAEVPQLAAQVSLHAAELPPGHTTLRSNVGISLKFSHSAAHKEATERAAQPISVVQSSFGPAPQ
jgi:hypothetical protein